MHLYVLVRKMLPAVPTRPAQGVPPLPGRASGAGEPAFGLQLWTGVLTSWFEPNSRTHLTVQRAIRTQGVFKVPSGR
jgi:hypothetical protein